MTNEQAVQDEVKHPHASYSAGLRDLANMDHVLPEVGDVLRDSADLIDRLAATRTGDADTPDRGEGHPFDGIKNAIHADPEYAWGWLCNLAVPMQDAIGASHQQSNQAAALIMAQMFDYDITKHPHYEGGKSFAQEYFEGRVEAEREEDAGL